MRSKISKLISIKLSYPPFYLFLNGNHHFIELVNRIQRNEKHPHLANRLAKLGALLFICLDQ